MSVLHNCFFVVEVFEHGLVVEPDKKTGYVSCWLFSLHFQLQPHCLIGMTHRPIIPRSSISSLGCSECPKELLGVYNSFLSVLGCGATYVCC